MAKMTNAPKQLFERRNTDDVFSRLIILGVLRVLNLKLRYTLVWSDTEEGIQDVVVPFFFNFSAANTTEKFILDHYAYWSADECTSIGIKPMAGDYKPIPYGVVNLESTTIEPGNISNRFVIGQYQRKVGKEMKSFVSFLYSIPLTMSFNVNIACDTINSMWKIEQAFREYFYKNKTFHVNYKGTVVPARIGFTENLSALKVDSYSFGLSADGADIKLTFSITVETYQPVFDQLNEIPAGLYANTNAGIHLQNITENNGNIVKYTSNQIGRIIPETIFKDDAVITLGQEILLLWNFLYEHTDLLYVDILYKEIDNDNYNLIETVENHNCYHLTLDDTILDLQSLIDIIIPNSDDAMIVNNPKIKLYPNVADNIVNQENVQVLDKGFILTDKHSIDALLSYEDVKGNIIEKPILINIENNMVDEKNPVSFKSFIYNNSLRYKLIKLYVRDNLHQDIICPLLEDDNWITVF